MALSAAIRKQLSSRARPSPPPSAATADRTAEEGDLPPFSYYLSATPSKQQVDKTSISKPSAPVINGTPYSEFNDLRQMGVHLDTDDDAGFGAAASG